jgi:hypothetical protein
MYSLESTPRLSWIAILKVNCSSLFQTALLVSADPRVAEAGVMAAVEEFDVLLPPKDQDIGELHKTVAVNAIKSLRSQGSLSASQARSMLQPGLWPLLQVDQCPRICYVLRMLLGCAMSSCAQILGLEESDVRALLQVALLQLCQASQDACPQIDQTVGPEVLSNEFVI